MMNVYALVLRIGLMVLALGVASFANLSTANAQSILIVKDDPRTITDLQVQVFYKINGAWHYDFEDILGSGGSATFNRNRDLELRQASGTFTDGFWLGEYLYSRPTQPTYCSSNGKCEIWIRKTEPRTITDLTVAVWFKINGVWHYDYEQASFLGFSGGCGGGYLSIDASVSGTTTWDGSKWVGNILKTGLMPVC